VRELIAGLKAAGLQALSTIAAADVPIVPAIGTRCDPKAVLVVIESEPKLVSFH
jgi:hypothetical protein